MNNSKKNLPDAPKKRVWSWIITALVMACALFPPLVDQVASAAPVAPVVIDGQIDLSNWDFAKDGSVELDGDWATFPNQHLGPRAAVAARIDAAKVSIPDIWGPALTLSPETGYGKATYVLRVEGPKGDEQLGLGPFRMRSIVEISAHVPSADGGEGETYLLVRPRDIRRQEDLHAAPIFLPFVAGTFDLVFLIENHSHKQGGIIEPPTIGHRGAIEAAAGLERDIVSAFVAILASVSLIGLIIGLALKGGRIYVIFAVVAFFAAARIVTTSQLLGDIFPELTLARKYEIEYVVLFLSLPTIYGFTACLFPKENIRFFQVILNVASATMVAFAFATPVMSPGAVTLLREPFQVLAVITMAFAMVVCARAFLHKRRMAQIAMACMGILSVSILAEISFYVGVLPYAVNTGHVGITLVSAVFVAGAVLRFRAVQFDREVMNTQLQDLNANLEGRTAELEAANLKATAASDAKSNFLAVLSHEIRTPLTGILGMAQVLEAEIPNLEHKRLMGSVKQAGKGLLRILNDMLDLSKIEAGAIELEKTKFSLSEMVEHMDDLWTLQLREKGLSFKVTCGCECDQVLLGDIGRIRQILYNLIGNARKFTATGGVTVACSNRKRRDGRVEITFAVTDTGIGIHPDKQHLIFGRFNQADASTTRQYGGTGLGLSICRDFANLMNGRVWVESEPGKGSTFYFTVSCDLADSVEPEETFMDLEKPVEVGALHILVAEDVMLNQEIIRRMLVGMGHEVTLVENGQEAVNVCTADRFDLVLMDLQMPVLDGVAATRMIRRLPGTAGKTPIVALTANLADDVEADIRKAGMSELVAKPIDIGQLALAIAHSQQGRTAPGALSDRTPEATEAAETREAAE